MREVELCHRLGDDVEIAGALACQWVEMRGATQQHVMRDGHPEGDLGQLGNEGDDVCPVAMTHACDRSAEDVDAPARGQDAGERPQEACLPGTVRADDRDPLPLSDRDVDIVDDASGVELDRHFAGVDGRPHTLTSRVERSSTKKTGAPTTAVITLIGTSVGASVVRAMRSARQRNAPPYTIDSGRIFR